MRITEIRERPVQISRYYDPRTAPSDLTTSIVAVVTDVVREGTPVVGYGFSSFGRYAQSGLIAERFAPRLLEAREEELLGASSETFDPLRAWNVMMRGEKPGGHGERCVAVGTLDMAMWDAAAKIAGEPLHRFLRRSLNRNVAERAEIPVYAGGGYYYPDSDRARLADEVRAFLASGYTHVKIKVGKAALAEDCKRIETVLDLLPSGANLAIDAMNRYGETSSAEAASAFRQYGLWWFEDICDPHDFELQAATAQSYGSAIAVGEPIFSLAETRLLNVYGRLRPNKDILVFDPVHAYGVAGYLQIVDYLLGAGWPASAFWPHGGHLFTAHVVRALGLGGAEVNPRSFAPFGGLADRTAVEGGCATLTDAPGVGFEEKRDLIDLFRALN